MAPQVRAPRKRKGPAEHDFDPDSDSEAEAERLLQLGSGGGGGGSSSSSSTVLPPPPPPVPMAEEEARGEKRSATPTRPGSSLEAAQERTGSPQKTQRLSAVQAYVAVEDQPTCADVDEARVLEAYQHHSMLRPIYDSASGVGLRPELVREARSEEVEEIRKHKVYRKVLRHGFLCSNPGVTRHPPSRNWNW